MKRTKPNPERAGRDNPVWTKDTFKRARPAHEVLSKLFGSSTAEKMLKPWPAKKMKRRQKRT